MSTKTFIYRNNTGGSNLRSNEANINTGVERTEMMLINNMEIYRDGGFASQKGNVQLNTGVTDTSKILAIGEYKTASATYAIYTKASGKAYSMPSIGGPETQIKTGLDTEAITQWVSFNSKVVGFNGVNQPWSWNGTTAVDLTGTPASWVSTKPTTAAVFGGKRIFAAAGSSIYYCALGNELDWTTPSDAGSLTGLFNDNTNITGITEYGSALSVHSASPGITLIAGTQPSDYTAKRIASNRAMAGKLAFATINDLQFFFSGDGILPLLTTDLGIIRLGKEYEISTKIKPFLTATETELAINAINSAYNSSVILLPNYARNELIAYFKTSGNTYFDTAAIYNFDSQNWAFRQASLVTAAARVGDSILTGTSDGKILKEFSGTTLVSGTFTKRLLSGYYDFGAPNLKKRLTRMYFWFKTTTDLDVTLKLRTDYNTAIEVTRRITQSGVSGSTNYSGGAYGDSSYAASNVMPIQFPVNIDMSKSVQIDLVSSDPTVDFRLIQYGFEVEYGDEY